MARNIIFYFSGTGNSLKAAKDIAAVLGDTELVFMKGSHRFDGAYDRIGFVFPSYAMGAPKAVLEFIKSLPLNSASSSYVFSLVTCNRGDGNASMMINKALSKKGLCLNYANVIQMVGNYIVLYDIPENQSQLLQEARKKTTVISEDIKNKVKRASPKTRMSNSLFYKIAAQYYKAKEKQFQVSNACVSCGLCAKLCPMENIEIVNGKPKFLHKNCANCMACIHWCPHKAINCGNITPKRKRYHHPDIMPEELYKSR